MVKRITAGLVSVGLIGGVGAVTYDDDGTPTVTVDDHGTKSEVTLPMVVAGKTYRCPASAEDTMSPYDVNAGRIALTLRVVRRQETKIEKRHPGKTAPKAVADRFNKLVSRERRLVGRYNVAVDKRNAILRTDCTT